MQQDSFLMHMYTEIHNTLNNLVTYNKVIFFLETYYHNINCYFNVIITIVIAMN
jgi:hypothetical protein